MKQYLKICLLGLVAAGSAQAVLELNGYAFGGAGGILSVGKYQVGTVVGQPAGPVWRADTDTLRTGFWLLATADLSTPTVSVPEHGSGITVRIASSRAEVLFDMPMATQGNVRVLAADGRVLSPLWSGALVAGTNAVTLDLTTLPSQASFIVIEAGSERKTLQFHPVSR
jgi:hypothetical protein